MLDGAHNVRDLGGLPTRDGGETVAGAVFRGDALDELTGAGVRRLRDELGVRLVIDLRAEVENRGEPPDWADESPGLRVVALPLSDVFGGWDELTAAGTAETLMSRRYMSYLDGAADNLVEALRLLGEAAGTTPAIVHCTVGKDRTGVTVAVLLELLGVRRETIVSDYAATAPNLAPIIARLHAHPLHAEQIRTFPPEVYEAHAHTMEQFLAGMDERFGGAERWARDAGLSPETIAALRAGLVRLPT